MSAKKSPSNVRPQDIEEFHAKLKILHLELSSSSLVAQHRLCPRWILEWERIKCFNYYGPTRVSIATDEGIQVSRVSILVDWRTQCANGWNTSTSYICRKRMLCQCQDADQEMRFYTDGENRPIGKANSHTVMS
jgi:hypothetical protein